MRELGARLVDWTEGNPFFTEEVIRALRETGHLEGAPGSLRTSHAVGALPVPQTVHAVIAARIDRLPGAQRRILLTASALGMEFDPTLLAAVDSHRRRRP